MFVNDCIGDEARQAIQDMGMGEVILLENLRFHAAEKKGDDAFAKALADLGCDVYINDAFGTAHRAHASVATITKYFPKSNRMFGFLMAKEIENAQHLLNKAQRPFTAILGGAKVSDKIMLIESLLEKVDNILIGGGMAYTFHKAMGGNIGKSLLEEDKIELAQSLMEKAAKKGVQILLPAGSVIADDFSNNANIKECNSQLFPTIGWVWI